MSEIEKLKQIDLLSESKHHNFRDLDLNPGLIHFTNLD